MRDLICYIRASYLQHMVEGQERWFHRWRESGYADMAARVNYECYRNEATRIVCLQSSERASK